MTDIRQIALDTLKSGAPGLSEQTREVLAGIIARKANLTTTPVAETVGERFAYVSLDRGSYPGDLIDHLNGFITGGSGRCREALEARGVVIAPVASGGQHSSATDFPPGEVTDEWAERFCEAVNWSPDGQECKAVEGQVRCVSFRELAKGYILSAIATQPAITPVTAASAQARIAELQALVASIRRAQRDVIRAEIEQEGYTPISDAEDRATAAEARADRAETRIAEIATMFGVCDGGRYLNDWKARLAALQQETQP